MDAGRELDALVAEKVMGWKRGIANRGQMPWYPPEAIARGYGGRLSVPAYSTDIAAAWQVVEHMRQQGWLVTVIEHPEEWPSPVRHVCQFYPIKEGLIYAPGMGAWTASGASASHAICLAALKATEGQV